MVTVNGLAIGQTTAQVRAILGEPDIRHRHPVSYEYFGGAYGMALRDVSFTGEALPPQQRCLYVTFTKGLAWHINGGALELEGRTLAVSGGPVPDLRDTLGEPLASGGGLIVASNWRLGELSVDIYSSHGILCAVSLETVAARREIEYLSLHHSSKRLAVIALQEAFLDMDEICSLLGISRSTYYRYLRELRTATEET
ncbi:MAG: hypothetical protein AB7S38_33170 [Vulcanimicrobiota bacterium]